ncbi:MAG: serine hydrolase domain-containing protein [Bacteroidota bacterium]
MEISYPSTFISSICAILLSLGIGQISPAQTTDDRTQQLAHSLDALRANRLIPGMGVAVSHNEQLVFSQGFGLADIDQQLPATDETLFRLASVSKLLTMTAIAKLYQDGKLDIHATVETYIKDYPHAGKGVTIKRLCGHLGGIRHYKAKDFISNGKHFDNTDQALKTFIDDDLIHAPGTAYRYTTFGFVLLQGVVEAASGQSFLDYLETEILHPLDMRRTFPDQKDSLYQNRSLLYKIGRNDKVKQTRFDDPSYKWGGGGMLSCVRDLVKLGEAHLRPGFFTQPTLDSLFSPQILMPHSNTHIGLTWRISEDSNGDRMYHHAGNMNGARSLLVIYPERNIVIAIQNNLSNMPRILKVAGLVKEALFEDAPVENFDFVGRMK